MILEIHLFFFFTTSTIMIHAGLDTTNTDWIPHDPVCMFEAKKKKKKRFSFEFTNALKETVLISVV